MSNLNWSQAIKGTRQYNYFQPTSATRVMGMICPGLILELLGLKAVQQLQQSLFFFVFAYKEDICRMGTFYKWCDYLCRLLILRGPLLKFYVSVSSHLEAQREFRWWRDIYVKKLIKIKLGAHQITMNKYGIRWLSLPLIQSASISLWYTVPQLTEWCAKSGGWGWSFL